MGENNLEVKELEKNKEENVEKTKENKDNEKNLEASENKKEVKKTNKKGIIIGTIIIVAILFVLILLSTIFALININNDNIINGVKIEGIDVSGLSKEEAKTKIEELYEEKNQNNTVETSTKVSNSNDNYFSTSKLERDTMYSQMLETYENILNSSNSLETQKQSATEEIKKINDTKNSIMICENLIKTKGFENSIIFVNGESISIVVKDDQLTTEKVAQIQNIISREMNAKVENIHISNK